MTFNFKSSILPKGSNHSLKVENKSVREVLEIIKSKYNLAYKVIGKRSIVLTLIVKKSYFTISGIVEEVHSGEKIIGAFIYDLEKKNITQTNENGFFSIRLPHRDTNVLVFSRVGYDKFYLYTTAKQDQKVIIHLAPIKMEATLVQKRHKRSLSNQYRFHLGNILFQAGRPRIPKTDPKSNPNLHFRIICANAFSPQQNFQTSQPKNRNEKSTGVHEIRQRCHIGLDEHICK